MFWRDKDVSILPRQGAVAQRCIRHCRDALTMMPVFSVEHGRRITKAEWSERRAARLARQQPASPAWRHQSLRELVE